MFLYRDHRGTLLDSMETIQEMHNFSDLEKHLHKLFGPGNITVKPYCHDKRTRWDTHLVCHNDCAVGYTNKALFKIRE